jgi:hypothetical protein
MTAMGGVMWAWLVFLALAAVLRFKLRMPVDVQPYVWAVPLGALGFLAPITAFVTGVGMIIFLVFPTHLAVQFCLALFRYGQDRAQRLVVYGVPLAVMAGVAVAAKWALYSQYGGLRTFVMYYSQMWPAIVVIMAIGGAVTYPAVRRATQRSGGATPSAPAQA